MNIYQGITCLYTLINVSIVLYNKNTQNDKNMLWIH